MAKRIAVSDHFYLDEFVAPQLYSAMGSKSIWYVEQRRIDRAEWIRLATGKPVVINNWWNGGQYHDSGLRIPSCSIGAFLSMHKFSTADDWKIKGMTPIEVRDFILQSEKMFIEKQWITRMEDVKFTPSWNHVDAANTMLDHILIVRP